MTRFEGTEGVLPKDCFQMHILKRVFKHKCQIIIKIRCHLPLYNTIDIDTRRITIIFCLVQRQEKVTQQTGVPGELSKMLGRMLSLEAGSEKT